jgi:LysM repeat protein
MSSMGAVAVWGPISGGRVGPRPVVASSGRSSSGAEVRLTRRGRFVRFLGTVSVALLIGVLALGRVVGAPARADVSVAPAPLLTQSVVVEQGDSLWIIAQRVAPQRDPREVIHEVRELNGLRSNLIQPGQVLIVPSVRES